MLSTGLKLENSKVFWAGKLVFVSKAAYSATSSRLNLLKEDLSTILKRTGITIIVILFSPIIALLFIWYKLFFKSAINRYDSLICDYNKIHEKVFEEMKNGKKLRDFNFFNDAEDYAKSRKRLDELLGMSSKMQSIRDEEIDNLSFFYKTLLMPSYEFAFKLEEFIQAYRNILLLFDAENEENKFFKFTSENELWKGRSRAYEYRR